MTRNGGTPSKQSIIELLACNDKAVARAVVALYRRQTADEQAQTVTKHENGRGFNQADGSIGAQHAQALLRLAHFGDVPVAYLRIVAAFWRTPQGNTTRIAKYAGQLLEIALERWAEKQLTLEERV